MDGVTRKILSVIELFVWQMRADIAGLERVQTRRLSTVWRVSGAERVIGRYIGATAMGRRFVSCN